MLGVRQVEFAPLMSRSSLTASARVVGRISGNASPAAAIAVSPDGATKVTRRSRERVMAPAEFLSRFPNKPIPLPMPPEDLNNHNILTHLSGVKQNSLSVN
jgi:hypothetical protein